MKLGIHPRLQVEFKKKKIVEGRRKWLRAIRNKDCKASSKLLYCKKIHLVYKKFIQWILTE